MKKTVFAVLASVLIATPAMAHPNHLRNLRNLRPTKVLLPVLSTMSLAWLIRLSVEGVQRQAAVPQILAAAQARQAAWSIFRPGLDLVSRLPQAPRTVLQQTGFISGPNPTGMASYPFR